MSYYVGFPNLNGFKEHQKRSYSNFVLQTTKESFQINRRTFKNKSDTSTNVSKENSAI